ncbi:2S albumin [Morella rubra]|uniref:2S albumin n=1 Tax=Morella rubra TaxID=262757 RepID=A0A6A1UJ64_9ROSI|nr:2S albumin [Morella rubra]
MARLSTLAALAAIFFIAHASAHRTTITVDIDEDIENPMQGESCREQLQQQQYLRHCQNYMRQQSQGPGRFDEDNQMQHFQQCCRQLRQMDRECRCEGLRQMMRQMQGMMRGEEMQEMTEMARDLPGECGVGPQRCQMRSGGY